MFDDHLPNRKFDIVNRANFSVQNTLTGSVNTDRNHNLRVMSTPTWPVPYYQRQFRHPANIDQYKGDLLYFNVALHDAHALVAKELLKLEGKGYVVEAIENHYQLDSYLTAFGDANQFTQAYVDDLLDCIGTAREQDVRLLNEHDYNDVFK